MGRGRAELLFHNLPDEEDSAVKKPARLASHRGVARRAEG